MSEQTVTGTSSVASDRQAEVDKAVRQAADAAVQRHPEHAGAIRAALDELSGHLHRAHEASGTAAAPAWSAYRDQLDRGLDELHIELADTAQQPTVLNEALAAKTSRLELDGWRLRFETLADQAARSGPAELDRLRALAALDASASKAEVDAALAELRSAAS